jgi:hypothetical protein
MNQLHFIKEALLDIDDMKISWYEQELGFSYDFV